LYPDVENFGIFFHIRVMDEEKDNGVDQECALSLILFNFALEYITNVQWK
jgi:hypothetical protein